MNFKNIYAQLIGITLLCTIANNICATPFILRNNSEYDIFYRCRSNAEAAANQNFDCNNGVLKAGDNVELDDKRNYSIKVAGTSPLMKYSTFYDIPSYSDLVRELSKEDRGKIDIAIYKPKCTYVITVQSGIVYGWRFKIGYTCMN